LCRAGTKKHIGAFFLSKFDPQILNHPAAQAAANGLALAGIILLMCAFAICVIALCRRNRVIDPTSLYRQTTLIEDGVKQADIAQVSQICSIFLNLLAIEAKQNPDAVHRLLKSRRHARSFKSTLAKREALPATA